jgi:predicted DsbA family dithiol-disulfide isomerase
MSNATGPVIEVFADVWCPFAYVGLRTMAGELRGRGRSDVSLHIRSWPLELVNGAPMNPDKTEEHIHHLRASVAPDLFRGFNRSTFPSTTIPAMALTARAYRRGADVGTEVAFAVREALFEEGRDIASDAVLRTLADRFGTGMPEQADIDAVTADWHEGQARGVIGSPQFFCGKATGFCPSLDITRDPEHGMQISLDRAGITAFLDAALGT